jgi:hypothetical protein
MTRRYRRDRQRRVRSRPDTLGTAMRGIGTVLLVSPAVPAQEIAVIDNAVRQGATHVIKVTGKATTAVR